MNVKNGRRIIRWKDGFPPNCGLWGPVNSLAYGAESICDGFAGLLIDTNDSMTALQINFLGP